MPNMDICNESVFCVPPGDEDCKLVFHPVFEIISVRDVEIVLGTQPFADVVEPHVFELFVWSFLEFVDVVSEIGIGEWRVGVQLESCFPAG